MKVQYKREMRHNYLILEALEENLESFEIRMLTCNSIEGILRFRVKHGEESCLYYYEITSKQPLSRLLEFKEIRKEELGKLIAGIGTALNHVEEYLLQESNVLLEPEFIYIEPDTYQVWLCYVPGYQGDFPAAMGKLLHFLLKKADHQDNDTVVLAYRLYQESQKDYFGMEDLIKAVNESQRGEPRNPEPRYPKEEIRQSLNRKSSLSEEEKEEKITVIKRNDDHLPEKKRPNPVGDDMAGMRKERAEEASKEKKKQERKTTRLAVSMLGIFILAVPLTVWLLLGSTGLKLYGKAIGAADGAALVLVLLFCLQRRKKEKKENNKHKDKKESGSGSESENWYMTFEEEEEMEEDHEEEGTLKSYEAGLQSFRLEEQHMNEESGGTVLLAEIKGSESRNHLLKSLDPLVEDIPILYFPFIIGKQEGIVDYVLKKDTVSRLHARLDMEDGSCRITDLNSSNGTSISGRPLEANESCMICSGDKIQIADLSFIFY